MLKHFLQAYHQGYRDGLHGTHESFVIPTLPDDQRTDSGHQSDLVSRPAYRAGFLAGRQDRTMLSRTRPGGM